MDINSEILETAASYNVRLNNEALKKLAQKEEPRFLSILLRDKECLMDCVTYGIKPGTKGHFWDSDARHMFNLIFAYYQKYQNVLTRTSVDSIMDSVGSIGGIAIDDEHRARTRMYWDKIYGMDAPIEDYNFLRENINNRFVQWQAYEIFKEELEKIVRATSNQNELIKKAKDRLLKIDNLDSDKYTLTMDMKEGITKTVEYINKRRENPEDNPAIMCGIKGIDDLFCGFAPGSYNIITGMINGGKTTLMFNIAFNMARAGYGVVYVSLEKEAVPLYTRLLSLHALVDYNRIKRGGKSDKGLSDYYYSKLMEAAKDLEENIKPNFTCIQSAQGTKLTKIFAEVDKIKSSKKVDVLVVDYLGVIGAETHHSARPDLDEALTSLRLQSYGRVNHFATITAVQLKTPSVKDIRNKSKKATVEDISKVEVNTEDLAGSKMIIADADNAIAVILNSDSPATKMFVFSTKARDDEARRTICLDFDGKLGRVSDPIFEPGQITEVDQLVYNAEITEEKLNSDDGLFSDPTPSPTPSQTNETTTKTTTPKKKEIKEKSKSENKDIDFLDLPIKDNVEESDIDNLIDTQPENPDPDNDPDIDDNGTDGKFFNMD